MVNGNSVFYEIYIVRIKYNENNELVQSMSKPCVHCLEKLKKTNISIVHYTTNNNIVSEYVDKMTTTHISKYNRKNKKNDF